MAKLQSIATEECLQTLTEHLGIMYFAVFFSDGTSVLKASMDCTAKLWNIEGQECLQICSGHMDKHADCVCVCVCAEDCLHNQSVLSTEPCKQLQDCL